MNKDEVIAKAWKDPNFKKAFKQNPKAFLRDCFAKEINVIEDEKDTITLVIPSHPSGSSQISERELSEMSSQDDSCLCAGRVTY